MNIIYDFIPHGLEDKVYFYMENIGINVMLIIRVLYLVQRIVFHSIFVRTLGSDQNGR